MEKYNYSKWLTAFKENAVKYKKEVSDNKKLFNHTKEQITKKYGEYLKLVKGNKLIKITKDLSKDIKAYTFEGDNYPFDLFNICGEDEYYFGWNVIDNVDRKISKNIKNKKSELLNLFNILQYITQKGPDSHNYKCHKEFEDLHKYEENATHIFGKCLMDCNDYMVKEFTKNNLPYRYLSYNYKKPTHYSTNPSSMDFSFQGITSKQIDLVKSLIKEAGFEIVKDEVVKRNIVKIVKDDLAKVNNNYVVSVYAKEINEINNIKKLVVQ